MKNNHFMNLLIMFIGTFIFAFGIVHFNMQHNLGEGGFTGIHLILYFLWGINPSISNLVLNLPLFIIAWLILGRSSFFYTIIGTVFVTVNLYFFERNSFDLNLSNDMTLVAIFAGVFIGIGLGLVFRAGGNTGGVDIIARVLERFFGFSIGKTIFVFDLFIISLSMFLVLDLVNGLYTIVSVFIASKIIDFIQEGAYSARGAWIISMKPDELANKIMLDMDRGVTIFEAKGSYTNQPRNILYCVVSKNELFKLKRLIQLTDPNAFISLTSVNEVIGEGFYTDETYQKIYKKEKKQK